MMQREIFKAGQITDCYLTILPPSRKYRKYDEKKVKKINLFLLYTDYIAERGLYDLLFEWGKSDFKKKCSVLTCFIVVLTLLGIVVVPSNSALIHKERRELAIRRRIP